MAIFLIRGNAGSEARSAIETGLLAVIPDLVEASNFNRVFELASKTKTGKPAIVLVVAPPGDHGYFDRLVEVAAQYRDEVFLILIGDEISASDSKRLVRTGGAEWASAKAGPREVIDIIARHRQDGSASSTPASSAARSSTAAVTIAFCSQCRRSWQFDASGIELADSILWHIRNRGSAKFAL